MKWWAHRSTRLGFRAHGYEPLRIHQRFELLSSLFTFSPLDKKSYLNPQKIKYYMYQLLKAIEHMHKNGIFHRDIKPENILLLGDHIKLADFGSCKGMFSEHPYTEYISTRWYRAPECLLTDGYYDYKVKCSLRLKFKSKDGYLGCGMRFLWNRVPFPTIPRKQRIGPNP